MKILVTLYPSDAEGNRFQDCLDCAMSRGVKRLVKSNVRVIQGVSHAWVGGEFIRHENFGLENFKKLKFLPAGSFMVYEMDIPEQLLKDEIIQNYKSKVKETSNVTK